MSFPPPDVDWPTLSDWQFQFNNLTLGAGTQYGVLNVEGLDLGTLIRTGDKGWPRDHGEALGLDLYGGRDLLFDLWMNAGGGENLQELQRKLALATGVSPNEEIPLWFRLPNFGSHYFGILCSMCRPRQRKIKIDADYASGSVAKPEVSFHATDPRLYAAPELAGTFFATFKNEGVIIVENEGNVETRPILRIKGPLENPNIIFPVGSPKLAFEISLAAKEFLEVNLATPHLVEVYTEAFPEDRSSAMSTLKSESKWWTLPPGSYTIHVHTEKAGGSGGVGEASVDIEWASAYML